MASYKLLLADDSITIQRVIEMTFSGEDVDVVTVGDGEEAIAKIPTERPDIVLADIGMPKRNGYEVAAFVKGRPDLAHIPVVLLAGAFEPVDEARAQQSGSAGVLTKPFEPQHVIARVRELLGGATGNPGQAAAADIPRPVARLAGPRPVELPRRERSETIDVHETPMAFDDLPIQREAQAIDHPAAEGDDSLDDYFDRLDAAFADLDGSEQGNDARHGGRRDGRQRGQAESRRPEGPVMERDLDYIDSAPPPAAPAAPLSWDALDDHPGQAPLTVEVNEIPTLEELLGEVGEEEGSDERFSFATDRSPMDLPLHVEPEPLPAPPPAPPVARVAAPVVPPVEPPVAVAPPPPAQTPAALPVQTPVLVTPPAPVAPPVPAPPPSVPPSAPAPVAAREPETRGVIADAFAALFAVEEGEPGATGIRLSAARPEPVITDELIDQVATRVMERLQAQSGQSANDVVARIVSEVAERLVRQEIERIRGRQ